MKKDNKKNENKITQNKRGLASASAETRLRVARKGGRAKHDLRGLQAANKETRKRVASSGGKVSQKS